MAYPRETYEKETYEKKPPKTIRYKKETHQKETHKKETYVKPKYDAYKTIEKVLAMFQINIDTGIVTYKGEEPSTNADGYLSFVIKGYKRPFLCHKLVWMAANKTFVPEKYQLHHIDRNRQNNRYSNLQCVTKREHEKIHGRKFKNFRNE